MVTRWYTANEGFLKATVRFFTEMIQIRSFLVFVNYNLRPLRYTL